MHFINISEIQKRMNTVLLIDEILRINDPIPMSPQLIMCSNEALRTSAWELAIKPRENNSYLIVSKKKKRKNEGFTWMNKRCRLLSLSQFFKLSTDQPRGETHPQSYLTSSMSITYGRRQDRNEAMQITWSHMFYSLSNIKPVEIENIILFCSHRPLVTFS